jgi:hypothetical protein
MAVFDPNRKSQSGTNRRNEISTVPGCVSLRFDVCRFNDWRGGFETVALTQRRRLVGASEGGEGIRRRFQRTPWYTDDFFRKLFRGSRGRFR